MWAIALPFKVAAPAAHGLGVTKCSTSLLKSLLYQTTGALFSFHQHKPQHGIFDVHTIWVPETLSLAPPQCVFDLSYLPISMFMLVLHVMSMP
ncbi:hypothetical protein K432DRAFT_26418 [Lepidopterella palustris CBS 459.81]|uniref:Uncharacterized protein n=1 Tax=Lepidopterella palustris CBS 459.81 TaxID=1314670 RepID=A0A8E2EK49_9PEZI|nr:hypothetical protein K432DRAFT_26418 [Lepidopterella palustris CBS 459.81]